MKLSFVVAIPLMLLATCHVLAEGESPAGESAQTTFVRGLRFGMLSSAGRVTLRITNESDGNVVVRTDLQARLEHQCFGVPVSINIETESADGRVIVPFTLSRDGRWSSSVASSDPISDNLASYESRDLFVGWRNEVLITFDFRALSQELRRRYLPDNSSVPVRWRFLLPLVIEGTKPLVIASDWGDLRGE
jgi:hypothetical protein